MKTETITISKALGQDFAGVLDCNLLELERLTGVRFFIDTSSILIKGDKAKVVLALDLTKKLVAVLEKGEQISTSKIRQAFDMIEAGDSDKIASLYKDVVAVNSRGVQIKAKTSGQKKLVDSINKNPLTFAIGPAGTGKTYLSVALAAGHLKERKVERIILTRPAVESGEKLGFLPGDMQQKVDPYLRPVFDCLQEMLGLEKFSSFLEKGIIEVAPLAFMRGRTLNRAFVILDEAQNTTKEQMKMFLTRIGEGTKVVVNGDITQIDLAPHIECGLKNATQILANLKDIAIVTLTKGDVVRSELVHRIVAAYEKHKN